VSIRPDLDATDVRRCPNCRGLKLVWVMPTGDPDRPFFYFDDGGWDRGMWATDDDMAPCPVCNGSGGVFPAPPGTVIPAPEPAPQFWVLLAAEVPTDPNN